MAPSPQGTCLGPNRKACVVVGRPAEAGLRPNRSAPAIGCQPLKTARGIGRDEPSKQDLNGRKRFVAANGLVEAENAVTRPRRGALHVDPTALCLQNVVDRIDVLRVLAAGGGSRFDPGEITN